MGASALEKVAHSAETVMSSVSSGQLIFEGDLLEVLLRVLDTIRGLRAELLEGRTVTKPPGTFCWHWRLLAVPRMTKVRQPPAFGSRTAGPNCTRIMNCSSVCRSYLPKSCLN